MADGLVHCVGKGGRYPTYINFIMQPHIMNESENLLVFFRQSHFSAYLPFVTTLFLLYFHQNLAITDEEQSTSFDTLDCLLE